MPETPPGPAAAQTFSESSVERRPKSDGGSVVLHSRSGAMADGVLFQTIRNVETGEERTANLGKGQWTCSVTWCAGSLRDGSGVRERRDGTDRHAIPSVFLPGMVNPRPVMGGFIMGGGGHTVLCDLATGKVGSVTNLGGGTRGMGAERLYYTEKNGYQLIDLAAI